MTGIAELFAARRFLEALPILEAAVARSPDDWRLLADLTVAKKHARDFAGVRAAGVRAFELGMPTDDGSAWNVGIAATALSDWALARRVWAGLKIPIEEGSTPIDDERFGGAFVRVGGDAPETLWCQRLCPARAKVLSVPFPESGRRHGDVLLHDGESRGTRDVGGGTLLPVFDELALLQRSPLATVIVRIEASSPQDVAALADALGDACAAWEDWTESVAFTCQACSEGACAMHPEPAWRSERAIGLATTRPIEDAALASWEGAGPHRSILEILEEPEG